MTVPLARARARSARHGASGAACGPQKRRWPGFSRRRNDGAKPGHGRHGGGARNDLLDVAVGEMVSGAVRGKCGGRAGDAGGSLGRIRPRDDLRRPKRRVGRERRLCEAGGLTDTPIAGAVGGPQIAGALKRASARNGPGHVPPADRRLGLAQFRRASAGAARVRESSRR